MRIITLFFLLFLGQSVFQEALSVTKQQAYDQCMLCKTNPISCIGYNNGPYACYDLTQSVPYPSNAFLMSYATGCNQPWTSCPNVNTFSFTGTYPTCGSGQTYNPNTASCQCPSGQVVVSGSCQAAPVDCTIHDYNTVDSGCPLELSTGWEEHVCYDYTQQSVMVVPACNPSCSEGQHVEGNSCVDNPTCIGDQTYNYSTNSCDEPVCVGAQVLDAANHVCNEPECIPGQVLCGHICITSNDCGIGYQDTCDTGQLSCQFQGCPSGYVFGVLNSANICVKSGDTTTATATTTTPETTATTTETATTTDTATGNTSTTTSNSTTTFQGGSSTTTIDMDTSGLAQESTQVGMLDTLKKILGEPSDYDVTAKTNELKGNLQQNATEFASEMTNTSNPYEGMAGTSGSWLPDMPSDNGCSGTIPINVHGFSYEFAPCEKLQPLREVLAWVFYVITAIVIFNLIFKTGY